MVRRRIRGRFETLDGHTLRGDDVDGACCPELRLIELQRGADDPARVALHEAIHAAAPDLAEHCVDRIERAICDVLRGAARAGWLGDAPPK